MTNQITTEVTPRTEQHLIQPEHTIASLESHSANSHPCSTPTACRAEALSEGGVTIIVGADSRIQPRASSPHIRNGKIARLPKLERDLVNRMLHNNIPYAKIVGALDEVGITATQRNISNWKTRGGYKEWCAEQERQLQLSLLQDHLTDYLRKNDASQLPEVGLQVAATQLSLVLLQPEAAQQLAADPQKYSHVVDMLCRLSTQIHSLQKDRDQAVKNAAIRGTSEQIKRQDEEDVERVREVFSSKKGKSDYDSIPHRNDNRRRDELPFQEPPPKPITLQDIRDYTRRTGRT